MLEQSLENLENQVALLTEAVLHLTQQLNAGTTPVTPAKTVPAKAPKKAKPTTSPKAVSEPKALTQVEDVQSALTDLATTHGRDAALAVLNGFNAKKLGDLDKNQYANVISAVANYQHQEVA